MRVLKGIWPIVILCSALAALVTMFAFPQFILRPWLIFWFLFFCPGSAVVRFFHIKELATKLALTLALSFAIDGLVVGIILYSHLWSPSLIIVLLVTLTSVAVLVESTNLHVVLYRHASILQRAGALLTHPLVVGTNSPLPQPANAISDQPTVHIMSLQSSDVPRPVKAESQVAIEEKPTLHIEKLAVMEQKRQSGIEDVKTVYMASVSKPQSVVDQQDTRIEEAVKIAPSTPADIPLEKRAKELVIEEKPPSHMSVAAATNSVTPDSGPKGDNLRRVMQPGASRPVPVQQAASQKVPRRLPLKKDLPEHEDSIRKPIDSTGNAAEADTSQAVDEKKSAQDVLRNEVKSEPQSSELAQADNQEPTSGKSTPVQRRGAIRKVRMQG